MFPFTLDIYCTSVRPGRGIPHMWLSLRFLLSFYLLKGFFSSFSWLLLRVKGRGCHTLLKPYETSCGLWIWAIQIKFDWWLIEDWHHSHNYMQNIRLQRARPFQCFLLDELTWIYFTLKLDLQQTWKWNEDVPNSQWPLTFRRSLLPRVNCYNPPTFHKILLKKVWILEPGQIHNWIMVKRSEQTHPMNQCEIILALTNFLLQTWFKVM